MDYLSLTAGRLLSMNHNIIVIFILFIFSLGLVV